MYKIVWDVTILLVVFFVTFSVSVSLSFFDLSVEGVVGGNRMLITASLLLLLVDMLINMHTGFFEKGILVQNRVKVVRNYIN
jgi:hypothetical protein